MPQLPIAEWIKRIGHRPIPVLARTVRALTQIIDQDRIPLGEFADIVHRDPGLTAQILRITNSMHRGRLSTEITAVEPALLILGLERLRKLPATLPILDKILRDPARHRLLMTCSCAYHAAVQARDWALLRRDMQPDEVFAAAQQHFIGDMVLSIFGAEQLEHIERMIRDEHIADEEAQYIVLGFTLDQLSLALAQEWHLPTLVQQGLAAENAQHPRALGVMLAVQLARASEHGWYRPQVSALVEQGAELLGLKPDAMNARVHRTAVRAAQSSIYGVLPAAALLPLLPLPEPPAAQVEAVAEEAGICIMPNAAVLAEVMARLRRPAGLTSQTLMDTLMRGLHDGAGMNRAVFTMLSPDQQNLQVRALAGTENDTHFNRLTIPLDGANLFKRLLQRQQAVWLNDENRARLWPLVPEEFRTLIGTHSFFAMSIFVHDKAIGLFYADRHNDACGLDMRSYQHFKSLCIQAAAAIASLSPRRK